MVGQSTDCSSRNRSSVIGFGGSAGGSSFAPTNGDASKYHFSSAGRPQRALVLSEAASQRTGSISVSIVW